MTTYKQHSLIKRSAILILVVLLIIVTIHLAGAAHAGTVSLPQTGQTTTYATGDDGAIRAGVAWPGPRFTDNAKGTPLNNDRYENVATIDLSGANITSMAIYQAGNKIFVADDDKQAIYVIDGSTNKKIAEIPNIGGYVLQMEVNETYGKVYATSDKMSGTTGFTPGTGLISVIDANTYEVIKQINPGYQGNISYFRLGNNEVHNKMYVAFYSGVGVIDVASDKFTTISGANYPYPYLEKIAINTKTNDIFLPHYSSNRLNIINGETLDVQFFDLTTTGASKPLDILANEIENKVYITMISIPGQGEMGILILDRDTIHIILLEQKI
ncbi:MAG: hypothetical protein HQL05_15920 [Nitrospirae bacterium]|uniref:YncE family protein n=1 Tax=Candidatus Magnetobacterium casense TaxID=1455061 RepID=UPI00058AE7EB|nr:hypothetical protein [Candidatus Magnetobacterium casensis]MBF0339307.1 hypothetical protein [Nitrospirota bacterium]